MLIFNETPTIFPWYDKLEKQARYKENVSKVCDYKLITPKNALLPFQFYRTAISTWPVSWEIREINTEAVQYNLTSLLPSPAGYLKSKTVDGKDYFYYNGKSLPAVDLAMGFYYSVITFSDDTAFYSEMFHVPENSFSVDEDGEPVSAEAVEYLRLQFYNGCDIKPILYNDLTGDIPYFKQCLYLDSFVTNAEPELTVDATKDGNDQSIPTFQRVSIKHRITALVADYVKIGLSILPLHDTVKLTTQKGVHSGDIDRAAITSQIEFGGSYSTVDIVFEQELAVVKKECCDNMEAVECPEEVVPEITTLNSIDADEMDFGGTSSADGWIEIYGATSEVGPFTHMLNITPAEFAATLTVDPDGFTFFMVINRTPGCLIGQSAVEELT